MDVKKMPRNAIYTVNCYKLCLPSESMITYPT